MLSAGHARALLTVEDAARQERLAQRVVAEGLSVRAVEELVAVGENGEPRRRPRTASAPDPHAEELARQIGDRLDTRVRIEAGRSKGRIVIEYATPEDLARLCDGVNQAISRYISA